MRILLPLIVFLSACQSSPSISDELAALRQEIQEVKRANQPKLEAIEAMDDLAREVKQLRQMIANPPPPPTPPAPAPIVLGSPIKTGELAGGVGGTQAGLNDLYWVLAKVQVCGEERMVLCLYRAGRDGFTLTGARMLNADVQIVEYYSNGRGPSVKDILKELERQKK